MEYYIIALLICVILFFVLVIAFDSNRYVTREYNITSGKLNNYHRIVFVSDLHGKVYGKNNDKLIESIKKLEPDVILIGGDILTAYPGKDFSAAISFVKRLKTEFTVVYALGNHEYRTKIYPDVYGDMFERYKEQINKLGIEFLDNDSVEIFDDVTVYGLSIESNYYKRFKLQNMNPGYVEKMLGCNKEESFSILLAHNPDYFRSYIGWKPDLVLSGHLHGGVIGVPGWRGVISPMWRLFPKYAGGMYKEDESRMIVSRGLGMHTIPFRMFNPAEIVVIDLKKE